MKRYRTSAGEARQARPTPQNACHLREFAERTRRGASPRRGRAAPRRPEAGTPRGGAEPTSQRPHANPERHAERAENRPRPGPRSAARTPRGALAPRRNPHKYERRGAARPTRNEIETKSKPSRVEKEDSLAKRSERRHYTYILYTYSTQTQHQKNRVKTVNGRHMNI